MAVCVNRVRPHARRCRDFGFGVALVSYQVNEGASRVPRLFYSNTRACLALSTDHDLKRLRKL
jgi:hypothetical protein